MVKGFKEFLEEDQPPLLERVFVTEDGVTFDMLAEGKYVKGRFDNSIRIDQPTHLHGNGKVGAHLFDRKGNQYLVVNIDGTGSHGTKGRIHPKDADALRARGFTIPDDNIVEWTLMDNAPQLLLG